MWRNPINHSKQSIVALALIQVNLTQRIISTCTKNCWFRSEPNSETNFVYYFNICFPLLVGHDVYEYKALAA